jgi:serine/threonine protein phosphatase PrpC
MTTSPTRIDSPTSQPHSGTAFEVAMLSDVGNNRQNNEDCCGHWYDEGGDIILFAVADGIGGYAGGEVASAMAIEVTLAAYRESPPSWGPAKRLLRAVQRANIEIHNRALTIPELRRMGTTLTAVVVSDGVLHAAHVGDCRLYLIRQGRISQITKDHTAVQERVRMGLMTAAQARHHPERSGLTRSVGHELIASVDRITLGLEQHDRLILCSDGLHGVLEDRELEHAVRGLEADAACRRLIEMANQRGTADNLTVAVFTMKAETSTIHVPRGLWDRVMGWLGRR